MATKTKTAPVSAKIARQNPITTTVVEKAKSLTGNVGKGEFVKYSTRKGMLVCEFTIGVNSEETDECQWFNIVVFDDIAEYFRDNLGQGDLIKVTGNLKASEYTNKQNLAAVYFQLSVYKLKLIVKKDISQKETAVATATAVEDNIPF